MSVEQLAIDTKIPRSSIDALEEDRFTALPGPVFVKGFFRCCARSLSLDAEVVMSLLHEHERAAAQMKSGGRRERQVPQLLGRTASVATTTHSMGHASMGNHSMSNHSMGNASMSNAVAAPSMPRAPAASAPVHAVHGEPALANAPAAAAAPLLFDIRGLAPLLARLMEATRLASVIRGASNSRLLMWIAVSLLIALIVVTAFVMASGSGPGLPQS